MTRLRLLLGDQLNPDHSWFHTRCDRTVYVLMEVRQETDYVLHHAQKILAIFAAMRDFARRLRAQGHRVHYLAIDDPANLPSLTSNLDRLLAHYDATAFEYQEPDEWRLDRQLADYAATLALPARMAGSEHFYTHRHEAAAFFGGRRRWTMETFYRHMRKTRGVLMQAPGRPAGERWNFDHDNRQAWPGSPPEPGDARPMHDHRALWSTIVGAGVRSFGEPSEGAFRWPLNREEALHQLDRFIEEALPQFGNYQDAMSTSAHRLFHSLLSFALNTKMLAPDEVVGRAEAAWREGHVPLASAEGFIRQILGWREYVRGVYWARMPGYEHANAFGHERELPAWFWHARTRMNCMRHAIGQSLRDAHAHHIQRLMVIGNFALLAGLSPAQVHRWYLGVYVDAFEWVELPNTLGMSQFADGGLLATKPYVSSSAYIDRMSDYCATCFYRRREKTGARACPYNALYWDFFMRHAGTLARLPRLAIVYRQLDRMDAGAKAAWRAQASRTLENLEAL